MHSQTPKNSNAHKENFKKWINHMSGNMMLCLILSDYLFLENFQFKKKCTVDSQSTAI